MLRAGLGEFRCPFPEQTPFEPHRWEKRCHELSYVNVRETSGGKFAFQLGGGVTPTMVCLVIEVAPQTLVRRHRDNEMATGTDLLPEAAKDVLVTVQMLDHIKGAEKVEWVLERVLENVALDERA